MIPEMQCLITHVILVALFSETTAGVPILSKQRHTGICHSNLFRHLWYVKN